MSEDYKKIALEDVKEGQRVQIVDPYRSHIATYEGVVAGVDPELNEIELGEKEFGFTACIDPEYDITIFLLEDVPKPKVVRTATVKYYDDGTKTETPDTTVGVPMVIKTMDQFEEYEEHLKKTRLRDKDGDYWTCRNGRWCFHPQADAPLDDWVITMGTGLIEASFPMTVVENVGD